MATRAIPSWYRLAARVRGAGMVAGPLAIAAGWLGGSLLDLPAPAVLVLALGGFALLLVGMAATFVPGAPALEPRPVAPPVAGRWVAANSPADKRPSHGTHGQGQTFAIDLVYEPRPGDRPEFGNGPGFQPPSRFPAFGEPLYAPADAVVVRAYDRARDHRSRSNWTAYAYMMLEGSVRELGGSRFVLGNHVVLDLGDGVYAALAHMQRGTVAVRPGEHVHSGQLLGRCGNSGNTSEPHVHFQLMDSPRVFFAAGLPFEFTGLPVPRNEEALVAPPRRGGSAGGPQPEGAKRRNAQGDRAG